MIIIKPEQLLLAPSSSPWPQWLIPKIIFTFFSSRNLFSNFKIAQLLKRIQIYFKLGLTVADEVRRYADIWITPSQNTTMTKEMKKANQKIPFYVILKKVLKKEKEQRTYWKPSPGPAGQCCTCEFLKAVITRVNPLLSVPQLDRNRNWVSSTMSYHFWDVPEDTCT